MNNHINGELSTETCSVIWLLIGLSFIPNYTLFPWYLHTHKQGLHKTGLTISSFFFSFFFFLWGLVKGQAPPCVRRPCPETLHRVRLTIQDGLVAASASNKRLARRPSRIGFGRLLEKFWSPFRLGRNKFYGVVYASRTPIAMAPFGYDVHRATYYNATGYRNGETGWAGTEELSVFPVASSQGALHFWILTLVKCRKISGAEM